MPDGRLAGGEGQRGTDRSAPRWTHSLALAASVGIVFFLLAKLGLGLLAASEFVLTHPYLAHSFVNCNWRLSCGSSTSS